MQYFDQGILVQLSIQQLLCPRYVQGKRPWPQWVSHRVLEGLREGRPQLVHSRHLFLLYGPLQMPNRNPGNKEQLISIVKYPSLFSSDYRVLGMELSSSSRNSVLVAVKGLPPGGTRMTPMTLRATWSLAPWRPRRCPPPSPPPRRGPRSTAATLVGYLCLKICHLHSVYSAHPQIYRGDTR